MLIRVKIPLRIRVNLVVFFWCSRLSQSFVSVAIFYPIIVQLSANFQIHIGELALLASEGPHSDGTIESDGLTVQHGVANNLSTQARELVRVAQSVRERHLHIEIRK
jgi:hypothetical protein